MVVLNCKFCGEMVQREKLKAGATCFDCKMKRQSERAKKQIRGPKKKKEEVSLNDWPWKNLGY